MAFNPAQRIRHGAWRKSVGSLSAPAALLLAGASAGYVAKKIHERGNKPDRRRKFTAIERLTELNARLEKSS